jgi:threonine dehydrogenase-like Zn-dependent dehydrogenase
MEALVLTAPGVVTNKRVPVPHSPEGDDVLIRVTRAGVCGSELEAVATKSPRRVPPLIMGHEFAGRVEALGPGAAQAGWKVGDRVVPNPLVPCLRCRACARGLTNACPNRRMIGLHRDGGHAEWALVGHQQLHRIPDSMSDEQAATAEPLAVAVHGVRLLGGDAVLPESIAVFGAGTIGLLALQCARLAGASEVLVLDLDPHRLEIAKRLGATRAIDPRSSEGSGEGLLELAQQMAGTDGFDGAIDCVGHGNTRAAALQIVRTGGTVVWVGSAQDEVTVKGMDLLLRERRIQGSYAYTSEDFTTAISMLASGRVDVTSWSQTYPLTTSAGLIGRLLEHQEPCIKAFLDPSA